MKNYYLDLMGLRIKLCASHNISISKRMRPFLCKPYDDCDFTIFLSFQDVIPMKSDDGVWHGLEYYDYKDGEKRTFHHIDVERNPFAVTVFSKNGNVEIIARTGFEEYFEGSSGIFNRIGVENLLLDRKGLLLHASFVEYDGKAILFTGPSGVGKSTQADLWHSTLGAEIINGDRAVLRCIDGRWFAFGSSYAGSSGIYKNKSAPISSIVVLRQAKENRVTTLNHGQALSYVYPEIAVHHWDKDFVERATDLCLDLISNIPILYFECLPNEDAVYTLRKSLIL